MLQPLNRIWRVKDRELRFERPMIMGILNVTPDSFSDGGRFYSPDRALEQARLMIQAGADIVDIGGESSRPGAQSVSARDELQRVLPVIELLLENSEIMISIDTTKTEVARAALAAGAHIINDISGGSFDPLMFPLIAETGAGYVLMHMQGNPATMQQAPSYMEVRREIGVFFRRQLEHALELGLTREQIALDPGIGFGKTLEHNLTIMANLDAFAEFGRPLLLGASRKSFIAHLDGSGTGDRLGGSLAAVLAGLQQGAAIFRVHDVAETRQAIHIFTAIQSHSD